MADDCQSPIFLDFKKSRYLAAADISNATLMLTKSIYSVLLIYLSGRQQYEITMPAAGAVCSLFHLSIIDRTVMGRFVAK